MVVQLAGGMDGCVGWDGRWYGGEGGGDKMGVRGKE